MEKQICRFMNFQAGNLPTNVFFNRWHTFSSKSITDSLKMVIMRAQISVTISAGKVVPVNYETGISVSILISVT